MQPRPTDSAFLLNCQRAPCIHSLVGTSPAERPAYARGFQDTRDVREWRTAHAPPVSRVTCDSEELDSDTCYRCRCLTRSGVLYARQYENLPDDRYAAD